VGLCHSHGHGALDAGQKRELGYLLSQRSAWVNLPLAARLLVATGFAVLVGATVALLTFLADGPWWWLGVGAGAVMLLVLAAPVSAPERFLVWSVKATTPTSAAMRRGDSNSSWPG
jgi:cell division protein FtsW (lipid II flippase)